MPKTKKTETETSTATNVRHSIPTAGDRGSNRSRVMDRLRQKVKPNKKTIKDSDRPVIDIDDATQEKFVEFACNREIFNLVEARDKNLSNEVVSSIYECYVDVLWDSKTRPQNPSIEAKTNGKLDAEGKFIVSGGSRIKIDMPEVQDGELPEDALVRCLVDMGVDPDNAQNLVNNEVSFTPQFALNFTDLLRGEMKSNKIIPPTTTQMSAGEALLCAINGEDLDGNPLNEKSRSDLLRTISAEGWEALRLNVEARTTYYPVLVDGDGFLDSVCNYASSREELGLILTVFKPVKYCNAVKFAVSDSSETKKTRMLDASKSLLEDE